MVNGRDFEGGRSLNFGWLAGGLGHVDHPLHPYLHVFEVWVRKCS